MLDAMKTFSCANKVALTALTLAGISCVISYIITPVMFDKILSKVVDEILVLSPSTEFYKEWSEPEIPVIQRYYFFDVQNPEEIMNGGKPRVKERGPYTYSVMGIPVNITFNGNSTITFRKVLVFKFEPEMSVGLENETITTVNLPLAVSTANVKYESWWARLGVAAIAQIHNQEVFTKISIKDLLWGYKDPLLKSLQSLVGKHVIESDEFGMLLGKNNSISKDLYTIYTGEDDPMLLNTLDKFNGLSSLPWWNDEYANMINGSDLGAFFHSNVQPEETLNVFNPVMCRSIPYVHDETITSFDGVPLLHFHVPEYVYASPSDYPPNAGFCSDGPDCVPTGLFNISACAMGVPMALSHPHFLYAADEVLNSVDGLQASKVKHESHMGIEPIMGVPYTFDQRVQINVYMEEIDGISQTKGIPSMWYPMVWIETHGEMPDRIVNQYKTNISGSYDMVETIQWMCVFIGGAIVLCLMGFVALALVRVRRNNKRIQDKLADLEKAQKESFLSSNNTTTKDNDSNTLAETQLSVLTKQNKTEQLDTAPQGNNNNDNTDEEQQTMLYKTTRV